MIADTAQLIVALKLDDKFSGPMRGINTQLDTFIRNSSVRGGVSQIGQGIGTGLKNAAIIAVPAVAAIVTQIKAGVDSLRELERVEAQTAAVLESTNGAAGIQATEIRELAEEYENIGGIIDDKVIQAGANVLLTFTSIKEDAFEPALEAALDLSTAMGQDLQSSIVQVGKALQDPIRGVTALRRVGVNFTEEQVQQIKELVDAGRDLEAQQIILAELNKEFGGSFEAAGQTGEASMARFQDSIEGLQQNLARAFLPAIDRVARRLTEIFSNPETQRAVADFGERLAGFLTEENFDKAEDAVRGVFGYLAEIPWGAIGDGLRIAGNAARVAVDAFKSLPPGVQNALITLLAANKLTGGLVASGLGQLAGVALGSLKTITAGHVTVVGPVTGAPGAPGGGGGGLLGGLKAGVAAASPLIAAAAAVEVINFETYRQESRDRLQAILDELPRTPESIDESIERIQAQIDMERPLLEGVLFNTNVRPQLEDQIRELERVKANTERGAAAARDAIPWLERNKEEVRQLNQSEGRRFANLSSLTQAGNQKIQTLDANEGSRAANLQGLARTANGYGSRTAAATEATSRKNFSPVLKNTVNVNTTVKISATITKQAVDSVTSTISGGSTGGQIAL